MTEEVKPYSVWVSDVMRFRFWEEPSGPLPGNELSGRELRLKTEVLIRMWVMLAKGVD